MVGRAGREVRVTLTVTYVMVSFSKYWKAYTAPAGSGGVPVITPVEELIVSQVGVLLERE